MSDMLHEWITINTQGSLAVVEFGAGFFDKLAHVHPSVGTRIGIEIHQPYIDAAPDVVGVTKIAGDMQHFDRLVNPQHMHTALFVDTLEHLTQEEAVSLIRRVQESFQKILLFVPEGNHPQTYDAFNMGGEKYQTHRSTWYKDDLTALGFPNVVIAHNFHGDPNKDHGALFAVWTKP